MKQRFGSLTILAMLPGSAIELPWPAATGAHEHPSSATPLQLLSTPSPHVSGDGATAPAQLLQLPHVQVAEQVRVCVPALHAPTLDPQLIVSVAPAAHSPHAPPPSPPTRR